MIRQRARPEQLMGTSFNAIMPPPLSAEVKHTSKRMILGGEGGGQQHRAVSPKEHEQLQMRPYCYPKTLPLFRDVRTLSQPFPAAHACIWRSRFLMNSDDPPSCDEIEVMCKQAGYYSRESLLPKGTSARPSMPSKRPPCARACL
jgi:hypothetical protein